MTDKKLLNFPLGKLYYAGNTTIPDESETISEAARRLYGILDLLDTEVARAGDPPLLQSMLEIGSEVCSAMRTATYSLDNCAEAVIKSADLLRHTDESSKDAFDKLSEKTRTELRTLENRAEHHQLPRHTLPPALPDRTDPGAIHKPGASGTPGGPVDLPGSPLEVTPTRIGRGDLETPTIPSTPAPVDPDVDRRERATTEQNDRNDNTTTLPRSER